MNKRKWLIIIILLILTYTSFLSANIIRSKECKEPILYFSQTIYEHLDGGSKKYTCLFYNVYIVNKIIEVDGEMELETYSKVVPWFVDINKKNP